ncbi:hypothetical protein A3Q56_07035, partial [Intoshia linei]
TKRDLIFFKKVVAEMLNHAIDSYMNFAFPADEILPLQCKIKERMDNWNGNYSLTLIDTLDTLAVMEKYKKYEKYSILFLNNVYLKSDVNVSLFEANIRMLGGLISNHYISKKLQKHKLVLNLKYGVMDVSNTSLISIAHIGTLILEFGTISYLTGNDKYYNAVYKATEIAWSIRSDYDLVGTDIKITSNEWSNKYATVSGNIDSYYEYLLKAYITFNNVSFYKKFQTHYEAIIRYINKPPNFYRVNMHGPENIQDEYDALVAFWPGLQVLYGDFMTAFKNFNQFERVVKHYSFLLDNYLQKKPKSYLLRPEFYESNFYLYELTKNEKYIDNAIDALYNLNMYARGSCGFSSISNVFIFPAYTDNMDSYFLAETIKYIYLVFENSLETSVLQWDEFLFNTEAHFVPIYAPLSYCPIKINTTSFKENEHLRLQCKFHFLHLNWMGNIKVDSSEISSAIIFW